MGRGIPASVCYWGSKNTPGEEKEEEGDSVLGLCLAAASLGVRLKLPTLTPLCGDSCGDTTPGSSEFPYGEVFWEAPDPSRELCPCTGTTQRGLGFFYGCITAEGQASPRDQPSVPLGCPPQRCLMPARGKGRTWAASVWHPHASPAPQKPLGASPHSRKGLWICSSPSPATP